LWSDLLNVEREAKPLEGADANASPADAAVASLTTAKFVWFEKTHRRFRNDDYQ